MRSVSVKSLMTEEDMVRDCRIRSMGGFSDAAAIEVVSSIPDLCIVKPPSLLNNGLFSLSCNF